MLDLSLSKDISITNIWDAAIQEVNILFNTNYTELIGYPKFGTDFYRFLWGLSTNTHELKTYVTDLLATCTYLNQLQYNIVINTDYDKDNYEIIYTVKITIYDDYKDTELVFNLGNLLYTKKD